MAGPPILDGVGRAAAAARAETSVFSSQARAVVQRSELADVWTASVPGNPCSEHALIGVGIEG